MKCYLEKDIQEMLEEAYKIGFNASIQAVEEAVQRSKEGKMEIITEDDILTPRDKELLSALPDKYQVGQG